MKTVGLFSVVLGTWQAATSTSVVAAFGAVPESVGMLVWGVGLLALVALVRQRSAGTAAQGK